MTGKDETILNRDSYRKRQIERKTAINKGSKR